MLLHEYNTVSSDKVELEQAVDSLDRYRGQYNEQPCVYMCVSACACGACILHVARACGPCILHVARAYGVCMWGML